MNSNIGAEIEAIVKEAIESGDPDSAHKVTGKILMLVLAMALSYDDE